MGPDPLQQLDWLCFGADPKRESEENAEDTAEWDNRPSFDDANSASDDSDGESEGAKLKPPVRRVSAAMHEPLPRA